MTTLDLAYEEFGAAGRRGDPARAPGLGAQLDSIGRQLGESLRVFALDLRNHGRSPWAPTMALDEMAADVAAFIERHELRAATVLGHSLGGKVAMRLALTRPELAARLVVVDVAPAAYEHGFAGYIEALRRVDPSALQRRADADGGSRGDPRPRHPQLPFAEPGPSDGSLAWRVNLAALAANMATMMGFPIEPAAAYRGPALFLSGGRSDYVRPEHRPLIEELFPQATFAVIEGAGHWVHAERPAEFLGELRRFLAEPPAAGR